MKKGEQTANTNNRVEDEERGEELLSDEDFIVVAPEGDEPADADALDDDEADHDEESVNQPSDVPVATLTEAEVKDAKARSGWRRLFQSEDLPQVSLREILGGDFLVGHFLRRQIGFILLLVVLCIAYITNRYAAQQEIIEEENLRKELTEKKNYALTQYSELTRQSRQSMLEQRLKGNGDSTLAIPKEPPFFIRIKK